jgi:uncharacterized protein YwqG
MDEELLEAHGFGSLASILSEFEEPAIAFELAPPEDDGDRVTSRLGGAPFLPAGFEWPRNGGRELDFLLQIQLAEVAPLDPLRRLPGSGLLTFFYDLENQPWGYDPEALAGFRVVLSSAGSVEPASLPNEEYRLPERSLRFSPVTTLPHYGSRAMDRLEQAGGGSDESRWKAYTKLLAAVEHAAYPRGPALNRLFGHSANVQGDMQLEAQLVTHGLYCGNSSGYDDPRTRALEAGADDWVLLLQLDSDAGADLMWGDSGRLYYWVRREDLAACRFDRAWMGLQCY